MKGQFEQPLFNQGVHDPGPRPLGVVFFNAAFFSWDVTLRRRVRVTTRRGTKHEELNTVAPYYTQYVNLPLLYQYHDKDPSGRLKYYPAWNGTCNVTCLAMALESLGITALDFQGNWELMYSIWDYFSSDRRNSTSITTAATIKTIKVPPNWEKAKLHTKKHELTPTDLFEKRLPDFLQIVAIYHQYLKSDSLGHHQLLAGLLSGSGLSIVEEELEKARKQAAIDKSGTNYVSFIKGLSNYFGVSSTACEIENPTKKKLKTKPDH